MTTALVIRNQRHRIAATCEKNFGHSLGTVVVWPGKATCEKCGIKKNANEFYQGDNILRPVCRGCEPLRYCQIGQVLKPLADFELSPKGNYRLSCGACLAIRKERIRVAYKETNRANVKRWRDANRAKARAIKVRHNHKRRSNDGTFTAIEWKALCQRYKNRCLACGERKPLTVDHVIPVSLGGPNDISNIQPLCAACNSAKGNRVIDYRYTNIKAGG